MKAEIRDGVKWYLKKQLDETKAELRRNTRDIRRMAERQRILKVARHELSKLINSIK